MHWLLRVQLRGPLVLRVSHSSKYMQYGAPLFGSLAEILARRKGADRVHQAGVKV